MLVFPCIIVICDFCQLETVLFNIICHMISLFLVKKKQILSFVPFFICHFRLALFVYILFLSENVLYVKADVQSALPPPEHTPNRHQIEPPGSN